MRNRKTLVAFAIVLGMAPTGAFAQADETQPVFVQEDTGPVYRMNDGTVIRFGRTPPADNARIDVREALRPQVPTGPATPPAYCFNASPYC
jgi:hypothetical protein